MRSSFPLILFLLGSLVACSENERPPYLGSGYGVQCTVQARQCIAGVRNGQCQGYSELLPYLDSTGEACSTALTHEAADPECQEKSCKSCTEPECRDCVAVWDGVEVYAGSCPVGGAVGGGVGRPGTPQDPIVPGDVDVPPGAYVLVSIPSFGDRLSSGDILYKLVELNGQEPIGMGALEDDLHVVTPSSFERLVFTSSSAPPEQSSLSLPGIRARSVAFPNYEPLSPRVVIATNGVVQTYEIDGDTFNPVLPSVEQIGVVEVSPSPMWSVDEGLALLIEGGTSATYATGRTIAQEPFSFSAGAAIGLGAGEDDFWAVTPDGSLYRLATGTAIELATGPSRAGTTSALDGAIGVTASSAPGALVTLAQTGPSSGELRLFPGGNPNNPSPFVLPIEGNPHSLLVLDFDVQYAWVGVSRADGLYLEAYNLATRSMVEQVKLATGAQRVDMIVLGIPGEPLGEPATVDGFLHALVQF